MFPRIVFAAVAVLSIALLARAQGLGPQMPAPPEPGSASAAQMPVLSGTTGLGRATGGIDPARMREILTAARDAPPPQRGFGDQAMFDRYGRSVVLVVTKESLGSGTVVAGDGSILTNARMVRGLKTVGVIFKPMGAAAQAREADAIQAKVVRVDEIADLAVVRVARLPADVRPIAVGGLAKVGAAVHAIGHPFGETWSYTRGVISGVKVNYAWQSDDGVHHRADIVQMQSAANPGNSGASLLSDAGELVGVSASSRLQGESANMAIAATDARRVLTASADRLSPVRADATPREEKAIGCSPVRLSANRTKQNDGTLFVLDTDCNGRADATLVIPDGHLRPTLLLVDTNGNGKTDVTYVDQNNDMKFDYALYDTNEDGVTDLVGYDLDDNLDPARIVLAKA